MVLVADACPKLHTMGAAAPPGWKMTRDGHGALATIHLLTVIPRRTIMDRYDQTETSF